MRSIWLRRLMHLAQWTNVDAQANISSANPVPSLRRDRRRFLKASSFAGVASLLGAPHSLGYTLAATVQAAPRIVIIGAGLAGLCAAFYLKQAGFRAVVYEASTRLGGRVFSRTGQLAAGLTVELGGEFINSDHTDMLALTEAFGLRLFDRRQQAQRLDLPGSAYYFDGKAWSESELVELLRPLVAQISQDAALLENDWDNYAPQFDRMSVRGYLDKHAARIPQPVVRSLFETLIRVEYGAEAAESSALQLLFLAPSIEGEQLELLGYSDEAFSVQGGNSRIIDALAQILSGQIHTGHALTELVAQNGRGYELQFNSGLELSADYVILAVPFSALRRVKLRAPLPAKFRRFIRQTDLGRNEKLHAGFSQRKWRQTQGFVLDAWTRLGYSAVWDAGLAATERSDSVLTYYLGGQEVNRLDHYRGGITAAGQAFSRYLAHFIPGLDQYATGAFARTGWVRNPYIEGAYVNYKPGQLTRFGQYFWIESEDANEQQAVVFGQLVFAGEQLSDAYYGFMNGAAQTGRLSAQWVQQMLAQNDQAAWQLRARG